MALLHQWGVRDFQGLAHEMKMTKTYGLVHEMGMMNTYYNSEHQIIKNHDKCQVDCPPLAKDKALLRCTNENESERGG